MKTKIATLLVFFLTGICAMASAEARDLDAIQKEGVLRHLGVPYANFITGDGRGLDVEVMQLFAREIGVEYQYVKTSWKSVINDLTGKQVSSDGDNAKISGDAPVRGDVIANGLTILPWRQKVLNFSAPTFPTQVWLITGPRSPMTPITPSGDIDRDIAAVKSMLPGKTVLGKNNTCLDPKLYFLEDANAITSHFEGGLNELAPAIMQGDADTTLLDVADTLVALAKWPGQIKVLGPISPQQEMGVGFRKDSAALQQAFTTFFDKIRQNGSYNALVEKYYPDVFDYYPDFFSTK